MPIARPNVVPLVLGVCLSVLAPASIARAEAGASLTPDCGGVFDLCGYVGTDGTPVTPRRFEIARAFSDGLAAVRLNGAWGFLAPDGSMAITPRFDAVGDFRRDRAEAVADGLAGVIDRSGRFTIEPRFARAIPFTRDIALVRPKKPGAGPVTDLLDDRSLYGRYHLHHARRGRITDEPHEFKWFVRPGEDGPDGLIWASREGPIYERGYGLMDMAGDWVVEPRFGLVQALQENRAIVTEGTLLDRGQWGAVDESGHIAIPLEHDWLGSFQDGYALVRGPREESAEPGLPEQRREGLIRPDGTIVGGRLFEDARPPDGDRPAVVAEDGVWYVAREDGSLEREEPDGTIVASCPQGLTLVRADPRIEVRNAVGERALPMPVDFVSFGIPEERGIPMESINARELDCRAPIAIAVGDVVRREALWTYVRPDGRVLGPPRFATTYGFEDGHAIVATGARTDAADDRRWGIMNADGQLTVPLGREPIARLWDVASPDGRPVYARGSSEAVRTIDARGEPVVLPEAARDDGRDNALACPGGARIVGDGERFGIEGPGGATIVPIVHRAISCFRNGVAWAPDEEAGRWRAIGPDGTFRSRPAPIDSYYPMSVTHHFPETFADDPFESNVLWVRAWLRWGLGQRDEPPRWIGDGVTSEMSRSVIPFGGQ